MKRDVLVADTLLVVHLIATIDLDAMHFDRATRFRRHDHLVGDHLAEKRQKCGSIVLRAEAVTAAHKQLAESTRRGPIRAGHHVHAVCVRRWSLAHEMAVDRAPVRVRQIVVPSIITLLLAVTEEFFCSD